ncbi:MAG TPA: hypothetical protein VFU74_06500 [Actinocrinis sp.]|nr:hypothetical protein [Actinocrinis sp.]
MGAHRKPKSKPTAFAAVVTAAIVVPTGTAAAASYGALGSSSGGGGAASAGLLAKTQSAAMYAARSATRHATLVSAPIASPSASAKASASASASASAAKASAGAGSGASSSKSATATASPSPTKADPYANVTIASLEPTGLYGSQQHFTPNSAQWANAKTIVAVTKQRGMSLYAAVIAVATAMQESSLTNLTSATNYDSLGLFQQRPSMGWGTASQLTDPVYATNAFLAALTTYAPNYQSQSLWSSAQAVQRSGFPTAYAQWQDQAARMVQSIVKGSA